MMGMFDTVYVLENDIVKAEGFKEGYDFQTKDMENLLDTYKIHPDGRISMDDEFLDYTGVIKLYGHIEKEDGFRIVEFAAKFFDGKLQEIKKIRDEMIHLRKDRNEDSTHML